MFGHNHKKSMVEYNIQESVQQGRLIPTYKINMIGERIAFTMSITFFTLILWLPPLLGFFHDPYLKIGLLLFIVCISFLLSTYKWYRAMRLDKIYTGKDKGDNKKLIKEVIHNRGYNLSINNIDLIQAHDWLNRLELNFIIENNEIFLNVNYQFFRSTWPCSKKTKELISEIDKKNKAGI
jgi:hypothetical protein